MICTSDMMNWDIDANIHAQEDYLNDMRQASAHEGIRVILEDHDLENELDQLYRS